MTVGRVLLLLLCVVVILAGFASVRMHHRSEQAAMEREAAFAACRNIEAELAKPPEDYTYQLEVDKDNDLFTAQRSLAGRVSNVCASPDGSYQVVFDAGEIEWNVYGTGAQASAIRIGDCIGATVEYSDTGNSFQNPAEQKAHLPRFVSVAPARCTSDQSRK
jgi:Tfp pilus assembly protein PilX